MNQATGWSLTASRGQQLIESIVMGWMGGN